MSLTFATKTINFQNNRRIILLQNENGPCALLALVNVLLLSPKHTKISRDLISLVNDKKKVSLHELLETLADIALKIPNSDESFVNKLLVLLPNLHTGLNINPKFDGKIQNSDEVAIFNLFDVELVHGWVMDETTVSSKGISKYSYESAQDLLTTVADIKAKVLKVDNEEKLLTDATMLNEFLKESPTQFTEYGLSCLQNDTQRNSFYVFFRNDHFSTIYNSNGIIYALVTDLGFKHCKEITWEAIISIDGSSDTFCDDSFKEVSLEPEKSKTEENIRNLNMQISNDNDLARQLQEEEDRNAARSLKVDQSLGRAERQTSNKVKRKEKRPHNPSSYKSPNKQSPNKDCTIM